MPRHSSNSHKIRTVLWQHDTPQYLPSNSQHFFERLSDLQRHAAATVSHKPGKAMNTIVQKCIPKRPTSPPYQNWINRASETVKPVKKRKVLNICKILTESQNQSTRQAGLYTKSIKQPPKSGPIRYRSHITSEMAHTNLNLNPSNKSCHVTPDLKSDYTSTSEVFLAPKYDMLVKEQFILDRSVNNKDMSKMSLATDEWAHRKSSLHVPEKTNRIAQVVERGTGPRNSAKDVYIAPVPRVKTIVKKYYKFKQNDLEVRKLNENIVCLEYDVYNRCRGINGRCMHTLRTYFSVKPSHMKHDIASSKPQMNEKVVETIDDKIGVNKTYITDLDKILKKRSENMTRKKMSTIDLKYLYETAVNHRAAVDCDGSNTVLIPEAGINEVKKIILKTSAALIGIRKRTVKEHHTHSQSVINEILGNYI